MFFCKIQMFSAGMVKTKKQKKHILLINITMYIIYNYTTYYLSSQDMS